MNNVYGFFFPISYSGLHSTDSALPVQTCVFIGQEARYLDSGCSVIAWVIYGYICSVEHFYHFRPMWMNWSEL